MRFTLNKELNQKFPGKPYTLSGVRFRSEAVGEPYLRFDIPENNIRAQLKYTGFLLTFRRKYGEAGHQFEVWGKKSEI